MLGMPARATTTRRCAQAARRLNGIGRQSGSCLTAGCVLHGGALAVWPVMLFPNTVVVNEAAALKRVFLADFAESFALTFECHVEVAPSL